MLVRDDTTALMIDGFVSRPPLRRVLLRRVSPDRGKVTSALRRLGVERLDAVLCAHSPMDHARSTAGLAALGGRIRFAPRNEYLVADDAESTPSA